MNVDDDDDDDAHDDCRTFDLSLLYRILCIRLYDHWPQSVDVVLPRITHLWLAETLASD